MNDCLFCKIIEKQIPSTPIYEDEICYAFKDIHPQAPCHVLVVPKEHVTDLNQADTLKTPVLGHCLKVCKEVAHLCGVEETGYRVIINTGEDAAQTVKHLHFHVLGGMAMREKMV